MKNETLISFYGKKPESLSRYISEIISMLVSSELGDKVKFYSPEQMHGTLIGLESVEVEGRSCNRNFWEKEKKSVTMDLFLLEEVLEAYFPMQIRLGGFSRQDETFLSRGKKPWERSFILDQKQHRIVIMGWPDSSEPLLMNFREAMGKVCDARHKYDGDNDFYIVLGEWDNTLSDASKLSGIEDRIRDFMAEHPLELNIGELFIAEYTDPRLIPSSTRVRKIWSGKRHR